MDMNQKPTAERIRVFLQAMERSITSARQKRTNAQVPIRPQAVAPAAQPALAHQPMTLSGGAAQQVQRSAAVTTIPGPAQPPQRPHVPIGAMPPMRSPAPANPQAPAGDAPVKLKARRKDAGPVPSAPFQQQQRKAG